MRDRDCEGRFADLCRDGREVYFHLTLSVSYCVVKNAEERASGVAQVAHACLASMGPEFKP
jgi:hypothetical protein